METHVRPPGLQEGIQVVVKGAATISIYLIGSSIHPFHDTEAQRQLVLAQHQHLLFAGCCERALQHICNAWIQFNTQQRFHD